MKQQILTECVSVPTSTPTNNKLSAADMFRVGNAQCYDRDVMGETFVADAHNHFRPFGRARKFITEINQSLLDTSVLFVNVFCIGQSLPVSSTCEYYLDYVGTPKVAIANWGPFMKVLQERNIPISIHSDSRSNTEPFKYAYLMDEALRLYSNNKIVWMHMGLSKELSNANPDMWKNT